MTQRPVPEVTAQHSLLASHFIQTVERGFVFEGSVSHFARQLFEHRDRIQKGIRKENHRISNIPLKKLLLTVGVKKKKKKSEHSFFQ